MSDKAYQYYRDQADAAYKKRNQLSQQSQAAYKSGDKAKAGQLSQEAKKQLEIAEENNARAAEYVFIENNRDSDHDDIDLHGLYVKEAEYILKVRIKSGIEKRQPKLDCIVGKGKHSANGIAKLKPAIEQLCKEAGLRCWIDPKNTGVLHIDISSGRVPASWANIRSDGFAAMDANIYGQPQPAQQHQQQQQQQNYYQQPQQPQYTHQQPNNHNNNTGESLLLGLCAGICLKFLCSK